LLIYLNKQAFSTVLIRNKRFWSEATVFGKVSKKKIRNSSKKTIAYFFKKQKTFRKRLLVSCFFSAASAV
jgi:hypothetical protein